jgi:hypothetical protein
MFDVKKYNPQELVYILNPRSEEEAIAINRAIRAIVELQKRTGELDTELAEYRATGLSPEQVQELAKAKAEERLIELPIPIGGEYYRVWNDKTISGPLPVYNWNALIVAERYGKTDFPTREAAEIALKTLGGDTP